jgi:NADPH-dependent ferric siderophore reductase
VRLSFDAGGMLADHEVHPTMWVRMWFAGGDKLHQRRYTLVDPDPVADTVDVEFALHDGIASRWARAAQPGDTIGAIVLGSKFAVPEPPPAGYVIDGDSASLPAINSLLHAIDGAPAQVFLEAGYDDDKDLPVAPARMSPGWTARTTEKLWCRRSNRRPSKRATISAGWRAIAAPRGQSQRFCRRTSACRGNRLRPVPIGWSGAPWDD